MDIWQLGFTGVVAFGGTWVIDLLVKRFTKTVLTSELRFAISVIIVLVAGFIPADMGNDILNRLRDAAGVATGVAGFYQLLSKVASKVGTLDTTLVVEKKVEAVEGQG